MKDGTLDGKFDLVILRLFIKFIKFCTILYEWGMNFINHIHVIGNVMVLKKIRNKCTISKNVFREIGLFVLFLKKNNNKCNIRLLDRFIFLQFIFKRS